MVFPSTTLSDAIDYALESHVHRVWVVQGIVKHERKPLGVVSYSDMINHCRLILEKN